MRLLPVFLILAACATAPAPKPAPAAAPAAKKFAMRTYYMAILKVGPKYDPSRPDKKPLLAGHRKNIQRLAAEGKMLFAGPFDTNDTAPGTPVGIFLFDVPTKDEAEALTRTDPTIADGYFVAEVLPWYGPAGLTYDGRDDELAKIRAEQQAPAK